MVPHVGDIGENRIPEIVDQYQDHLLVLVGLRPQAVGAEVAEPGGGMRDGITETDNHPYFHLVGDTDIVMDLIDETDAMLHRRHHHHLIPDKTVIVEGRVCQTRCRK